MLEKEENADKKCWLFTKAECNGGEARDAGEKQEMAMIWRDFSRQNMSIYFLEVSDLNVTFKDTRINIKEIRKDGPIIFD